jgi:hypothetical protein
MKKIKDLLKTRNTPQVVKAEARLASGNPKRIALSGGIMINTLLSEERKHAGSKDWNDQMDENILVGDIDTKVMQYILKKELTWPSKTVEKGPVRKKISKATTSLAKSINSSLLELERAQQELPFNQEEAKPELEVETRKKSPEDAPTGIGEGLKIKGDILAKLRGQIDLQSLSLQVSGWPTASKPGRDQT